MHFFVLLLANEIFSNHYISSGADAKDLLSFRQTRKKKNEQSIEDVLDGRLYKAHFDNDGYFKGTEERKKKSELHISLQINTDGVALFRSSTFSIWPVYYIINELPPNCRYACS